MTFIYFSGYADDDVADDDVCVGKPSKSKVLGWTKSIPGGPLICLNYLGSPVLAGIASRNSKSIKKNSPGIFTNMFKLRRVIELIDAKFLAYQKIFNG